MVTVLLDRDKVPASELAERFTVSVRTVQRDMDALNLAGLPLFSEPGRNGGYGLMPGFKLTSSLFTKDDFADLTVALKGVQRAFADDRFAGTLERVRSLVPKAADQRLEERERSLVFDFSLGSDDSVLVGKLRLIDEAIRRNSVLRCEYSSHREAGVPRSIEPMTLILQWGGWYLFAYCRTRSDFRLFKVSRLASIKESGERFQRREKTYADFLVERPDFGNRGLVDLEFSVDASARAYVEENHPVREIAYRSDGSVSVRCVQPEEDRLYRYLLSYGAAIRVIGPDRIRERLRQIATGVAERNSAAPG